MIIIMFVTWLPAKELSSTETEDVSGNCLFSRLHGLRADGRKKQDHDLRSGCQALSSKAWQKMTYMSIVLIAAFCLGNVCLVVGHR